MDPLTAIKAFYTHTSHIVVGQYTGGASTINRLLHEQTYRTKEIYLLSVMDDEFRCILTHRGL